MRFKFGYKYDTLFKKYFDFISEKVPRFFVNMDSNRNVSILPMENVIPTLTEKVYVTAVLDMLETELKDLNNMNTQYSIVSK
jgi:hypothetical protein